MVKELELSLRILIILENEYNSLVCIRDTLEINGYSGQARTINAAMTLVEQAGQEIKESIND